MGALAAKARENLLDGRGLLLIVLVCACAVGARMLARGLGEAWSWAIFGAVLLGGQNLVIVGQSGGFRRRPIAAWSFLAGVVVAGALLGYWLHV